MALHTQSPNERDMVQIVLPDMFLFFLAQPPRVNAHYTPIRKASEDWLLGHGGFSDKISRFIRHTDFSYFCAVVIPDASSEALRELCDWGNWVFPFDDAFDNGLLKTNPGEAQVLVDGLTTITEDPTFEPQHPLLIAYKSIWVRFCQHSSQGTQTRLTTSMEAYCKAVLRQVQLQAENISIATIEAMLELRRDSIATTPIYAFIESAYNLDLPEEVIKHPSIRRIETIITDIVLIQNDIVSYAKEMALGESHNIVSVYRLQGNDLQQAFDCAGELLVGRYQDWYRTLTELPSWGENIDRQVQSYLGCVANVAVANLNWSYRAERYWNGNNKEVRRSRKVFLPADVVAVVPRQATPSIA